MGIKGSYEQWVRLKSLEWEAKCTRCGACCGSLEDPCENLRQGDDGRCSCVVYDNRFGTWKTVSGKPLLCVPIRQKLAQGHTWPGDRDCGYKKKP